MQKLYNGEEARAVCFSAYGVANAWHNADSFFLAAMESVKEKSSETENER